MLAQHFIDEEICPVTKLENDGACFSTKSLWYQKEFFSLYHRHYSIAKGIIKIRVLKGLKLLCSFNDILDNPKTVETVNYQETRNDGFIEICSTHPWTRDVSSFTPTVPSLDYHTWFSNLSITANKCLHGSTDSVQVFRNKTIVRLIEEKHQRLNSETCVF